MRGYNFSKFDPSAEGKTAFEQLLDIFMQLLTYTNGDVAEALNWMNQLDKEYQVTNDGYGMGDFIEDLKDKGTSPASATNKIPKPGPSSSATLLNKSISRHPSGTRRSIME